MLYTLLLVLLILDSILLVAAILMQAGQGGGMAASFGGVSSSASSFLGTRQAGNLLTKASWWCGGLFLGLSFLLALASTRGRAPKSVLDQTFTPPPVSAPAPVTGGANPTVPGLTPANPNTTAPTTQPPGNAPASGAASGTKKGAAPTAPAPKKP
ncbi:MAG TPA: preprotein translocase subunit SecG [Gemmatimonadaceae bacterium]|jgi:preprotein translocase subunit SecG|nr:preprotein translocase subunit SecG [Gemmatimonadaceae bacterium]